MGYCANFVFTADAPDTPQQPLSQLQQSLSLGGLTVNTALVPPSNTIIAKTSADAEGNLNTAFGFSLSNIFHLDFYRMKQRCSPNHH